MNVLDLWSVASFWNQSTSKATGVENRGQIEGFFLHCKNEGRVGDICLSELVKFNVWPNLWHTFDWTLLRGWEIERLMVKTGQSQR